MAYVIQAVSKNLGLRSETVRECYPPADIVFDRFYVIQNHSKAIQNKRGIEFMKTDSAGKELTKEAHYMLLKNAEKLNGQQSEKL